MSKAVFGAGWIAIVSCFGVAGQSMDATSLGSTALPDRPWLITQLNSVGELQRRWAGEKVFLDAEYGADPGKADFCRRFNAIARRFDINPPDVIIVKAPLDKEGKPKPQKADAGIAWGVLDSKYHDVIFVTEYLKNGLDDSELLAALAHEMGHVAQAKNLRHESKFIKGKKIEREADIFALSCPEVDPVAFKSMIRKTEKLTDAAARAHPLLYGDYTGSTAIIPASVQTEMALGGDHPMTGTRIKLADAEIRRRARAGSSGEQQSPGLAPQPEPHH